MYIVFYIASNLERIFKYSSQSNVWKNGWKRADACKRFLPLFKISRIKVYKKYPFFLDYANSRLSVTKCPFVRENEKRYELWCNVLFGSGVGVWGDRKVISGLFQQKPPFHFGIPSLKVVVEGGWLGGGLNWFHIDVRSITLAILSAIIYSRTQLLANCITPWHTAERLICPEGRVSSLNKSNPIMTYCLGQRQQNDIFVYYRISRWNGASKWKPSKSKTRNCLSNTGSWCLDDPRSELVSGLAIDLVLHRYSGPSTRRSRKARIDGTCERKHKRQLSTKGLLFCWRKQRYVIWRPEYLLKSEYTW